MAGCSRQQVFRKTDLIGGENVSIVIVAENRAAAEVAIDEGMAEMRRIDAMTSLYRNDSELARINNTAATVPVKITPELFALLQSAIEASKLTEGASDITAGPLTILWERRLGEGRVPADSEIKRVLPLVNVHNIYLEEKESTVFFRKPGMVLDLRRFEKGYALSRVAAMLRSRGMGNAMITVSQDLAALGRREDGKDWRVVLPDPRKSGKVLAVLDLSDRFLSTVNNGVIDPRTGTMPGIMRSVTVVGKQGERTPLLAAALFVAAPEHAAKISKQAGVEMILVDAQGKVTSSSGLPLAN